MYMHIFIIIILVNIFVIYLTHDEDHKVMCYSIYYASLTHACYIVLFCHSSTEEDQAQETGQSSDCITINDVVALNQKFFHVRVIKVNAISWPWTKDSFLSISVKTAFSQKPLDQLKATFMCKNYDSPESMMPYTISLPVPEKKSLGDHLDHVA